MFDEFFHSVHDVDVIIFIVPRHVTCINTYHCISRGNDISDDAMQGNSLQIN